MASIRRFDAPVVKSIFTPETWDVHQGPVEEDGHSPLMIGSSGGISKAISGDEYGRLMARLRRITPHTIREGTLASPFKEHRSSLSDPFARGGAKSIPGGASAASLSPSAAPASLSPSAAPGTSASTGLLDPSGRIEPTRIRRGSLTEIDGKIGVVGLDGIHRTLKELELLRSTKAARSKEFSGMSPAESSGLLTASTGTVAKRFGS